MLELSPWKDSLGFASLVFFCAMAVLALFENLAGKVRSGVTGGEEGSGEGGEDGGEEFEEVCQEADSEGGGLCLGLIFSLLIRFAITGKMAILHGSPRGKERWQVEALLWCLVMFAYISMSCGILQIYICSVEFAYAERTSCRSRGNCSAER